MIYSKLFYIDYIGDITKKLDNNKWRYSKFKVDKKTQEKALTINAIRNTFQGLQHMVESEEKQKNDVYPYRSRFISIIDRRQSKQSEEEDVVITYECKGKYTRDIPEDEASEWYIAASKTCLVPNMEYEEDVATGKPDPEKKAADQNEEKNKNPAEDTNVGASFHCRGGLLTFSFHVKAQDQIKCYLVM